MLSRVNSMVWSKEDEETSSWHQNKEMEMGDLSTFKSILESENQDWFITGGGHGHPPAHSFSPTFTPPDINNHHIFLQSLDSSASCSPNSAPAVFNNNLDPSQVNYFLQQKTNPLEGNCDYLESALNLNPQLMRSNNGGFGSGSPMMMMMMMNNRCSNILQPLDHDNFGAQPTLFQKRAALRKNLCGETSNLQVYDYGGKRRREGSEERERKDDVEDVITVDGGYDSDDQLLENKNKKKKGLPAKNLMAERRRRKKLNDRLYMLRSVVPKISKMDRASILGDAIDYLKELLEKISDLHNELQTSSSTVPTTPVGLAVAPTLQTPLSSPTAQPAPRVEVRVREGRAVNIHMLCARKPGLLLSILRAIDNLGLDIQQAVITSFNAFALDIFRAQQWEETQELNPDHIKAALLDSAGFHGVL
ncbi:hypothetical protein ACS0TY_034893 [Phlomoides rotata]